MSDIPVVDKQQDQSPDKPKQIYKEEEKKEPFVNVEAVVERKRDGKFHSKEEEKEKKNNNNISKEQTADGATPDTKQT